MDQCFICEQEFIYNRYLDGYIERYVCAECAIFAYKINRWACQQSDINLWRANNGVAWYYGRRGSGSRPLAFAKEAYIKNKNKNTDNICLICKILMPHSSLKECINCSTTKLLEEI
jgi:hypothetical protein